MKKVLIFSILGLFCAPAFSQDALEAALTSQYKKDKQKSDSKIQDPKANTKASTWQERAKIYEGIASSRDTTDIIDAEAAEKALEAYKKVVELDITKKGEPGKLAKEAQQILEAETPSELYNGFINQGVKRFQAKDLEAALKHFNSAQELFKKDTTGALFGGIAAQQIENSEAAITNYENFTKNGGKDPSVFYGLSQLYKAEKQYDKARDALKRGLEVNPGNKDLHSEIVNILLVSGKEDDAVKELTELVEKDPTNIINLTNLGILYDNSHSTYARKVRELEDQLGAASSQKDKIADQIEEEKSKAEVYEAEVKRLEARIKAQPRNAELKRQLSDVVTSKGQTTEAIAKLEADLQALEAANQGVDKDALQKELTEARAKQTEAKANATATYEKALAVDGNNYDALFGLGAIYYNEAVELKREVDNMNMQEYQQRGKEVESKVCGRFKKSRPYFEKATAVKPDSDAKDTLENINNIITQVEGKNIPCAE